LLRNRIVQEIQDVQPTGKRKYEMY